jgi:Tfp pilus assembly protein PilF
MKNKFKKGTRGMNIDQALQLAQDYLQKGNLPQAEYMLREILKIQPNNINMRQGVSP